jgi:hypothetical protein
MIDYDDKSMRSSVRILYNVGWIFFFTPLLMSAFLIIGGLFSMLFLFIGGIVFSLIISPGDFVLVWMVTASFISMIYLAYKIRNKKEKSLLHKLAKVIFRRFS